MMEDFYRTRLDKYWRIVPREVPVVWGHEIDLLSGYKEDGFRVLRGYLGDSTELLAQVLGRVVSLAESGKVYAVRDTVESASVRSALAVDDVVGVDEIVAMLEPLAQEILGDEVYIHQSRVNFKSPGGSGWTWHSDFETWHAQDGMPEMRCATFMIPLQSNNESNGPLKVLPGSHLYYYSAPEGDMSASADDNFADQKVGVVPCHVVGRVRLMTGKPIESCLCDPGDVVIFDCNLMHMSDANESGSGRANLFIVFNSVSNKLVAPFSYSEPRPEQMGRRNFE
jgi:ectoine hydroxylase